MPNLQNTTQSGNIVESPTENELSVAFPKVQYGGYLYIILFESGVIKAGRTKAPSQRIMNHASNAASFGTGVSKIWVSRHHDNYKANETALVARIASIATRQNKREYFEGITFMDAVQSVVGLVFDDVDFEAHEAHAVAVAEGMKKFLRGAYGESDVNQENPLMSWGLPIKEMFRQVMSAPEIDDSDSDLESMRALWASSAEAMGKSYEEVMDLSYLDVLEHLAKTFVHIAYLDTKLWALENGRKDLTMSMGERYGA